MRIAAGAVAPGVPHRDLFVSPDHCILFDDVLVVARLILNGSTIVQEPVDDVSYWHVELDSHDAILAEGLAAEGYLDCANRHNFANGAVASLHPHFDVPDWRAKMWAERSCAPHIPDGPRLAVLRGWLGSRADHLDAQVTSDPDLRLYADGNLLTPVSVADNCLRFDILDSVKTLRLRSRAGVPRHMHLLNNADDRRLGVSVRRIEIDGQTSA